MSLAVSQTPQRPLPGAYVATPAASRDYNTGIVSQHDSRPGLLAAGRQYGSQVQAQTDLQQRQPNGPVTKPPMTDLKPVQRAARTINQTLEKESRYPALRESAGTHVAPTLNPLQRLHHQTMIFQVK